MKYIFLIIRYNFKINYVLINFYRLLRIKIDIYIRIYNNLAKRY